MVLSSRRLLRCAALAATATSTLQAQQPAGRQSPPTASPTTPTVTQPAEGQVVAGDLLVTVQVPPGVTARRYTIEAAFWDDTRGSWRYPGTLGAEFAGGQTATTSIDAGVRLRIAPTATRWRIHVRVVDPPGGWGAWREFRWDTARPATGVAEPSAGPAAESVTRTPSAPAQPAGGNSGAPRGLVEASDRVSAAVASMQIDANSAARSRQSLRSLQSSVVGTRESLEYLLSLAGRLQAADHKKDLDRLRDLLANLKAEEDSLKKLLAKGTDDSAARGRLTQRMKEIGVELIRATNNVRSR